MGVAKYIGRIGALAVALGVGIATAVPASAADAPPPDTTALIVCGTTCPTPDDALVEAVKNQYIAPTHPGQDIEYVAVTTPEEFWPISGVFRLLGLALGPQSLFGLDGPAWPDEPWWKLSGLFDRSGDQSVRDGVADLEASMADHPNDHRVVFGVSQGAGVVNTEKRKLAEQYPKGTKAPDIDFVLAGDPNLPNGGLASRFGGLYIPILDLTFNGPAATDTQFDTVEIGRQYDGFSDLPLYPLNAVSLANALLGVVYAHMYILDVSLPADPTKSPAYQGKHGDTDYYFFENPDLPLFGPLRTLGVPESLIDVVEPFFRAIVELGYDRSIPAWEPTPARLIPPLNPAKVATDLVDAIGEGINNAATLFGLQPKDPAPVTLAAPATETGNAEMSSLAMSRSTSTPTRQTTVEEGNDDSNPAGDVDEGDDDLDPVSDVDEPTTSDTSTTGTTAADAGATTVSSLAASPSDDASSTAGDSAAGDSSGSDADGRN